MTAIAKAEHEMSAEELKAKYDALETGDGWSQHPDYPHSDWAYEASELNTLQGYWAWVSSQLEQRHLDALHGITPISDPAVKVRQVGGPEGETEWFISQNLTDRWGEINYHNSENKPLEALEENESLLARLRAQMWGEETFIVRKDGQYGILFEAEYTSIESEDDQSLKPHQQVVDALLHGMEKLVDQFTGVLFAVPDAGQIINDRPAAWAFVADGLLDEDQRNTLGHALVSL